ncbi:MAG: response regulator [Polyangiaceae bacterium]
MGSSLQKAKSQGAPGKPRGDDDVVSGELRVLLVEDNPGDAVLVREWLRRSGEPHRIWHLTRVAEAVSMLGSTEVDVVLLDLKLPDARGPRAVEAIRKVAPDVSIVVLTGSTDAEMARDCIAAGAHDYLEKEEAGPGNLRRAIAVARARAELSRTQARLFHIERLSTVGQLAAGVAHEINNPLQFVSGNVAVAQEGLEELMARESLGPAVNGQIERALEALADAGRGTERIQAVVRALSQFSRDDDAVVSTVNVVNIVREACEIVGHRVRRSAELVVHIAPTLPVRGMHSRLVQVIVNLLVNAAQAVEQVGGGRGRIEVSTQLDSGQVSIEVRDTGVGMNAATQRHIFDPFFTTKAAGEGTGLGLSLSHAIIVEHGGTIEVNSRPGDGTTFTIRLPVRQWAEEDTSRPPRSPSLAPTRRLRVLVVDDELLVLRALQRLLRDHDVCVAASADEALGIFAQRRDFDAVICDLSMPGMSGRALYTTVRQLDARLAKLFVFLTGGALNSDDQAFAAAHGVLEKPVNREALLNMLAEMAEQAN